MLPFVVNVLAGRGSWGMSSDLQSHSVLVFFTGPSEDVEALFSAWVDGVGPSLEAEGIEEGSLASWRSSSSSSLDISSVTFLLYPGSTSESSDASNLSSSLPEGTSTPRALLTSSSLSPLLHNSWFHDWMNWTQIDVKLAIHTIVRLFCSTEHP